MVAVQHSAFEETVCAFAQVSTSLCKCTDCLNIEIYAEDEEEYEDEEVNDTEDTGNDDDDLAEDPFGRNIFDDCFSL